MANVNLSLSTPENSEKEEKPKYLSDLHTDYHKVVGQKYGLERGIPYNELSAEEKRARRHKDKITHNFTNTCKILSQNY